MQDFKRLKVWAQGHELVLVVYRATATFPREETYNLISQMRRSSASIPTNIAEGCGRGGGAELSRFLQIASGSASELEYQLLLAHDLGYLPDESYEMLHLAVVEIKQMLSAFIRKLKKSPPT